MKAVWYDKQGAAHEVLKYGDMPTPEASPGDDPVFIRWRSEVSIASRFDRSGAAVGDDGEG